MMFFSLKGVNLSDGTLQVEFWHLLIEATATQTNKQVTMTMSLCPSQKKYVKIVDLVLIFILIIGSIVYCLQNINLSSVPYEDAAMLMRYSENFGNGYGITWNVGQKPVDGATDFLFMICVGIVYKFGVSIESSVRFIDLSSHFLTLLLIYFSSRKLFGASPLASFISAAFFSIGPGLSYISAYFGTPFFALFGCIAWIYALRIMRGNNRYDSLFFALTALITGLIRPEGVILTSLMLVSIVMMTGWRKSIVSIAWYLTIFLLLGGAYFVWHYLYFGYLLPNPFYVKGGGYIYLASLIESITNVLKLGFPFWFVYFIGCRNYRLRKQVLVYLLPVFGFAAAFILLSNEMNFGGRFQYIVLPIILISWHPFYKDLGSELALPQFRTYPFQTQLILVISGILLFSFIFNYQINNAGIITYSKDGRYDVAVFLRQFKYKGYTIATSEAGLLPLYSGWNAIDTWGLNDQWIAHNGLITEQYLDKTKPEVIMFHAYFSPLSPPDGSNPDKWMQMVLVLKKYAETHDYILAGAFGNSPSQSHYYYVKNGFQDSKLIINMIKNSDYSYFSGSGKSINYAYLCN